MRPLRLLLVTAVGALLLAACSHGPVQGSGTTTTGHSTTTGHTSTPSGPGGWSAYTLAAGADLSVVSCPSVATCVAGSTSGQSYELTIAGSRAIGSVGGSPSPQGAYYLACTSPSFCAAVPGVNQALTFNGSVWSAPATIPSAQGFTAIACTAPTFCVTIDGEGNSFIYNGTRWSGNVGAWGAANDISCASPTFCVAAEGGPSVWNGRAWTQPNSVDPQGQLNSVSCVSPSFCVAVDSAGDALTWSGSAFSAPAAIATEPPLSGTNASGLTGVSCPTTTFCRAVDSIGRVFSYDGTKWNAGTLIDNGGALTSVSCPTVTFCTAVDRHGRAYVWHSPSNS